MKNRVFVARAVLAAALLVAFGAGQAAAGPLTISPTTTMLATPTNNNIFNGGTYGQQFGYLGANLQLTGAAGTWLITYTYLGYEAGYTNFFGDLSDQFRFNNKLSPLAATFTQTVVSAGSPINLDFRFTANGSSGLQVTNGVNNFWPEVGPNFFLAIVGSPYATSGASAYVALDDQFFAGDDDNHDDLVVRVDARQVPDGGATLSLLGCALIGIGALRRRLRA